MERIVKSVLCSEVLALAPESASTAGNAIEETPA